MQRAETTARAVAGFIDLLIILALVRLPDVLGFLSAVGYLLFRDGLFDRQSVGKKLIGLRVVSCDDPGKPVSYRESIIRNVPFAVACLLFFVPYVGWLLGLLPLAIEWLTALGDERGLRVGDLIARTLIVGAPLPADSGVSASLEQQPDFAARQNSAPPPNDD